MTSIMLTNGIVDFIVGSFMFFQLTNAVNEKERPEKEPGISEAEQITLHKNLSRA